MRVTVTTFTPSPKQQAIFDWIEHGRGSAIVVAVAGSGKTTTVLRCLPHIPEHKHVQLFAFNSAIAKELRDRVAALQAEGGRAFAHVRAGTFHSVGFYAVCKHLGKRAPDVETDGKKVGKLMNNFFPRDVAEAYGTFAVKLVGYAKGEGIGAIVPDTEDAWWKLIQHHDLTLDSSEATEEQGIRVARELLARSNEAARAGIIDFDDQLYLPLLWKLRLWQNDFVFIDEAQDTNPVRRAIAKLALRPGGRLIAVGDPRQAIYGFTGASHDAIELIKKEFSAAELPLTTSYRCTKAIARHAAEVVPYFEAHEAAPEGDEPQTLPLPDALKVLTSHDAVLCRNTAPLIELAYDLIARGTGCRVLGREIGDGLIALIKKMRAKGVTSLLEKLEAYREREVAKHMARGEEGKAEAVSDRIACINTIADHLPETGRTVPALIDKISSLFTDSNGVLILSTIHKAKGREWETVAILRSSLMPSKWARQEWQQAQEQNLIYVARTRAKQRLLYIAE